MSPPTPVPCLPYQGHVTLFTHQPLRDIGMGKWMASVKRLKGDIARLRWGKVLLGDSPGIQAQASPKMKHVKENFQMPVAHQK